MIKTKISSIEKIENSKKVANELIDRGTYEAKEMDAGTTITAVSNNTKPEAVGSFNRPKNRNRKKYHLPARMFLLQ